MRSYNKIQHNGRPNKPDLPFVEESPLGSIFQLEGLRAVKTKRTFRLWLSDFRV